MLPKVAANVFATLLIAWFPIALMSGSSLLSLILVSPFIVFALLPLVVIVANQRYPGIILSKAASTLEILFFVLWFLVILSLNMGVRADSSLWELPTGLLRNLGVYDALEWGQMIFLGMVIVSMILAFAVPFQIRIDKRRLGKPKLLK